MVHPRAQAPLPVSTRLPQTIRLASRSFARGLRVGKRRLGPLPHTALGSGLCDVALPLEVVDRALRRLRLHEGRPHRRQLSFVRKPHRHALGIRSRQRLSARAHRAARAAASASSSPMRRSRAAA